MKVLGLIIVLFSLISCGNSSSKNGNNSSGVDASSLLSNSRRLIKKEDTESLEIAIRSDFGKIVSQESIIEKLKKIEDMNFQYYTGETIISIAAYYRMDEVISFVLSSNFVPDNNLTIKESSPFRTLLMGTNLNESLSKNDYNKFISIFKLLEKSGYKVDQTVDLKELGQVPNVQNTLFWANLNGHYNIALEILGSTTFDFNISQKTVIKAWRHRLIQLRSELDLSKPKYYQEEFLVPFIVSLSERIMSMYLNDSVSDQVAFYLSVRKSILNRRSYSSYENFRKARAIIKDLDKILL